MTIQCTVPFSSQAAVRGGPGLPWRETRRRCASDLSRLRAHYGLPPGFKTLASVCLTNSWISVFIFRIAHHLHANGQRVLARLCFLLNLWLTAAEFMPQSDVEEGLIVIHTTGTGFDCKMGKNVTLFGRCCIGGNPMNGRDVGAGPGLPYVQDEAVIGIGALVVGPVLIGRGAWIGPGAIVMKDVAAGAKAIPIPPRILGAEPAL